MCPSTKQKYFKNNWGAQQLVKGVDQLPQIFIQSSIYAEKTGWLKLTSTANILVPDATAYLQQSAGVHVLIDHDVVAEEGSHNIVPDQCVTCL